MRLLCALLLVVAAHAAEARREPCALGQFLTPDGDHLLVDVVAPATEAITVDATSVAITTGCPRIVVTPRVGRRATVIRATWPSCSVPFTAGSMPATVRVYLMVDAYPAARDVVAIPPS